MITIKYMGPADKRVFPIGSIRIAGLEETEAVFYRGEEEEVTEALADALVSNPALFGKFELGEGANQPKLPLEGVEAHPSTRSRVKSKLA